MKSQNPEIMTRGEKEIIKCKKCGSKIETYKSSKRKFCSKICLDVYRKQHPKEYPSWHLGKSWEDIHGKEKTKKLKIELSKRSKLLMKNRPDIAGKGKTLEERYNKEVAKKMRETLHYNANKIWQDRREYLLNTKNRFKKGQTPWNVRKKMDPTLIKIQLKTKEENFLKKLGIKNGN